MSAALPGAPAIVVVGCGNVLRGDDGVGPHVARALATRAPRGDDRVRVIDAGTDGMAAMFAARGCRTLVLIDACRSGADAGAVFEVPGGALEQVPAPVFSLHEFRWEHALFAARRLPAADFPDEVVVLLVEAESLDLGAGLSPRVAAAAERVAARVEALVQAPRAGAQARA